MLPFFGLICLTPYINSSTALLLGIFTALVFGNPYSKITQKLTQHLLAVSIIGLGAGINLDKISQIGLQAVGYTFIGIVTTISFGLVLIRCFKVERTTGLLITLGTAICGGSAIAATAPVIKAKSEQITIALAVVFLLNAVALVLFPAVGHFFKLSQSQFGLWSALAIHDTSSVVGVGIAYGEQALAIGTTVKLTRALWIIPVSLVLAMLTMYQQNQQYKQLVKTQPNTEHAPKTKIKKPWFILGFIIMAAIFSAFPQLETTGKVIETISKQLLVLSLFFIGSHLTRDTLKQVSVKFLLLACCLWVICSGFALVAIHLNWIELAYLDSCHL